MPRASIDCINLYYEKNGHGQPLLFIQGLGSSTQDWASQVGTFSAKYQMAMCAMGEALAPNLFPSPDQEALRRDFVEHWAENDPRAYIDSTLSMLNWNVTGQIGAIHCPTLILSADQDYTPIAVKEAYARLMPDSQVVVIPNTHHAVPMEAPALFNAALMEFLSKHA